MDRENAQNTALFHAVATEERRELRQRARALREERKAAQGKLAVIFAERHGWRQTPRPFGVDCLAVQGKNSHGSSFWPGPMMDHPCFFRKDGRAAAAVGHLYGFQDEWRDWAGENGLKLTLSEFPSWHWPSRCRLVIYTPLDAQDPARPFPVGRTFQCRLASVNSRIIASWNPRPPKKWTPKHWADWRKGGDKFLKLSTFAGAALLLASCAVPVDRMGGLHCVTYPPACERCLTHTFCAPGKRVGHAALNKLGGPENP